MDNQPKLTRLVIKPTLACTADCQFCTSRRSLHKELNRERHVQLSQWEEVLGDAKSLGAEYLVISGGEPTLYRYLTGLIRMGKKFGLAVTVNTNGFLITEKLAQNLLDAGLDSVCISLHSHLAGVHNAMKCQEGLWEKTTEGIRIFSRLTRHRPRFSLQTQAIVCRENFREFTDLLSLHRDCGSDLIRLAYLEGDFGKKYLLRKDEIREFRERTVPKALAFVNTLDSSLRKTAGLTLGRLFDPSIASLEDFENGLYNARYLEKEPCYIPSYQALILANGDVHPCNIVEYTHEPVMGNLFRNRLTEIWQGETWNRFRKEFFDYCKLCPMRYHTHVVLKKDRVSLPHLIRRRLGSLLRRLSRTERNPAENRPEHSL